MPGSLFPGMKGMFRTVKRPKHDFVITNNDVKYVGKRKKALVRKRAVLVVKDKKQMNSSSINSSTPQSINCSL